VISTLLASYFDGNGVVVVVVGVPESVVVVVGVEVEPQDESTNNAHKATNHKFIFFINNNC
jgi:hypothetical protein